MKYRNYGEISFPLFPFILAGTNRSWALRYFYYTAANLDKLSFLIIDIWGVFLFLREQIYKRIFISKLFSDCVLSIMYALKCTCSTNSSISNLNIKKIIFKQRGSKDMSVGVYWIFSSFYFHPKNDLETIILAFSPVVSSNPETQTLDD